MQAQRESRVRRKNYVRSENSRHFDQRRRCARNERGDSGRAVRTARASGMKVKGIRRGYAGLLNNEIIDMDSRMVSEIARIGGTILFTARCKEFETREGQEKGAQILKDSGIDGLIVIGGDGSFRGAQRLSALGINTIGIPGTIDPGH